MKLIQVEEFGFCNECAKTQRVFPKLKFYEIELGSEQVRTVSICEECLEQLKNAIGEEKKK